MNFGFTLRLFTSISVSKDIIADAKPVVNVDIPIDAIAPVENAAGVVIKTKICSTQPGIDSVASSIPCVINQIINQIMKQNDDVVGRALSAQ